MGNFVFEKTIITIPKRPRIKTIYEARDLI